MCIYPREDLELFRFTPWPVAASKCLGLKQWHTYTHLVHTYRHLGNWPFDLEQLTTMKIRARDRHLQHETDEKGALFLSICCIFSHHLLQSWKSLGFLLFYSTLLSMHYSTKFEFSLRHFGANSSLCEGNWRVKRGHPSLPDAFSWFKDRAWRVCLLGELSSADTPYAPGKGSCPVFEREGRSKGTVIPNSGGGCAIARLFPPVLAGEKAEGESPAQLSRALGTNSISP